MGITKQWFREHCSENNSSNPAYLKITIPGNATSIGTNAFCTNKANYDSNDRYNYIHPSNYKIVEVDFSSATSLNSIESVSYTHLQDLMDVTRESLFEGINAARPGNRLGDIGSAVQRYVEARGYSVVRDFVGHGVGAVSYTHLLSQA